MIIGIGTDIVQITRIEKVYAKYGDMFKHRILEGSELEKFDAISQFNKVKFLAKRFAAKEAISKAFGCGISENLSFKDIIIFNDKFGQPQVTIVDNKINLLSDIIFTRQIRDSGNIKNPEMSNLTKKNLKIDLSIADDYPTAIAFCVVSINP